MPGPLLTYAEAARVLTVSPQAVRRLAAAGHLDEVRITPSTPRIREDSVSRLLQHGYTTEAKEVA